MSQGHKALYDRQRLKYLILQEQLEELQDQARQRERDFSKVLSSNIKLKDTLHFVHSLQLELSNKVQFLKCSNVKDAAENKSVIEEMEELVTQLDRGVNVLIILQSDDIQTPLELTFKIDELSQYERTKSNDGTFQNKLQLSSQSFSSSSPQKASKNIERVQEYHDQSEQDREIFKSKDELFKRTNDRFTAIIDSKSSYLKALSQQIKEEKRLWREREINFNKAIKEVLEQLQTQQQTQQPLITIKATQERKVWRSIPSKVSSKRDFSTSPQLMRSKQFDKGELDNCSDSDCNVNEDEEQPTQSKKCAQQSASAEQESTSQKLENQLVQTMSLTSILKNVTSFQAERLNLEASMFKELQLVFNDVKELENRYCESKHAWEKEIKELTTTSKKRKERILALEAQLKNKDWTRNELQHKLSKLHKELDILYKSVQVEGQSQDPSNVDIASLKKIYEENQRLKSENQTLLGNIEGSRLDLHRFNSSSKPALTGLPNFMSEQYRVAKDIYEEHIQKLTRQFETKLNDSNQELQRSRQRLIEMIEEKQKLEAEIHDLRLSKKDLRHDLEIRVRRLQDLEMELQKARTNSTHIGLKSKSQSVAVQEVQQRNDILSESLDKVRLELLSHKKQLSQAENERFDFEKENSKQKTEIKGLLAQVNSLKEEKEHLLQMIQMKSHLLHQGGPLDDSNHKELDQFKAIQNLSRFVLNRGDEGVSTIDEHSKAVVRSIFNENVCKLMDQYETKIEQQRKLTTQLYQELRDLYRSNIDLQDTYISDLELLIHIVQQLGQDQMLDLPADLLVLNEKLQQKLVSFQQQNEDLQRDKNKKKDKLNSCLAKLEAVETDTPTDDKQTTSPSKIRQNIKQDLDQQNRQRLEDMQHIIDTLRMKLDLNTSENEELKRQLTSYKKKDTEIDKLKNQLEKLRNQNTKSMQEQKALQMNLEKHLSGNKDLKQVIKKLDTELKREKSQVNVLKQQLGDNSLFDGIGAFLEDYDRLESDERQNKKESKVTQDTISLGGDSIINSPIKRVNQMLKEDSKLSNNKRGLLDEDVVAMLECQSFAIEDVLKKKKKHGKKTPQQQQFNGKVS